jgi:hypothetical protein
MPKLKQFDVFIEDGLIHYQVVADDDTLICSAREPFDPKNPKHQRIERLVNKMGISARRFAMRTGTFFSSDSIGSFGSQTRS